MTWVDQLLLQLTLFVYWIIAESGAVVAMAYGIDAQTMAAADAYDNVAFWISLALFVLISVTSVLSASRLLVKRKLKQDQLEAKARLCMIKEEARMDAIRERCEKGKIDCDARRIKVGTWYRTQKGVFQNMEEEGMHVMGVGSGA